MSKKKVGNNRRAQKRGLKNKKRQKKKRDEARRKAGRAEALAHEWKASLRSLTVWEGTRGPAGLVTEDGAERPIDWVLFVERPSGIVVKSGVVAAGDANAMADVLHAAIDSPACGAPRIPQRVCIDDTDVAVAVAARFGAVLEVEISPTPLADEAGASLAKSLARDATSTYLERHGIEAAEAERLFGAIAELAPHRALLFDADEVRVSFSDDGGANPVAMLWNAEEHGVVLSISPGEAHFRRRFMHEDDDCPQHEPSPPDTTRDTGTLLVQLAPLEDLPPGMRTEIREQGWLRSDDRLCPVLTREALSGRDVPVTAADYCLAADVAKVLTKLASDRPEILRERDRWTKLSQRFGSAGVARVVYPGRVSDAELESALAEGALSSVELPADAYEAAAGLDVLTPLARKVLDRATPARDGEIYRIDAAENEHRHMAQLIATVARKRGGPNALIMAANRFVDAAFPAVLEASASSDRRPQPLRLSAAAMPGKRRAGNAGRKKPAREPRSLYQLKITLQGIRPPIWRRIEARSDIALEGLHRAIQNAMGWEDAHLHLFECAGTRYGPMDDDFDPFGQQTQNERTTPLSDVLQKPKDSLRYVYDFGDDWQHTVTLEKTTPLPIDRRAPRPRCIGGRRACPPEDCGGPPGYAALLQALRDPEHPEHESYREWLGATFEPEAF